MKSTLVAVALVLAILYGLKSFTREVAKPIERAPLCAKGQDSTYMMPYAMKLLNGDSIEEVATGLMRQGDAMAVAQTGLAPQVRPPQTPQSFLYRACAKVKAIRSESILHLRGLVIGPRPLIIINHVTLAPGEEARLPLGARTVTIRCLDVTPQSAQILVDGKLSTLYLASEHGTPP